MNWNQIYNLNPKNNIVLYLDQNIIEIKTLHARIANELIEELIPEKDIFEIIDGVKQQKLDLVIIAPQPLNVLTQFKTQIRVIQAGGGLVQNPDGHYLFIYRRGKWDLPKGKKEDNENIEECALREVEEEAGINGLHNPVHLCNTYHIYKEDNEFVLKETVWYNMQAPMQSLTPQAEEGIKKAEWMDKSQMRRIYANTYPSIKYMVDGFVINNMLS
jgi:8-oxo-dGTP pyrophosphatase MutT (NUDIX family)